MTALAGGDVKQALVQGAAPYLAEQVKKATEGNTTANIIGHALVGGVVAELSGQNATVGATGTAAGELAARAIASNMFNGKDISELSESERRQVSDLSTLAAGLAGGVSGDSTASTVAGAKAGQNAVENNYLSNAQQAQKSTELTNCPHWLCREIIHTKWDGVDAGQDALFVGGMVAGVPGEIAETVKGLVQSITSPIQTYQAMKSLILEGNIAEAVKQSYVERIDRMEAEYEKAGIEGASKAGYEVGKLLTDVASWGFSGVGAAKGGVSLAEKVAVRATQLERAAGEASALEKVASGTAVLEKREALPQLKANEVATNLGIDKVSKINADEINFSQNTVSYNKVERRSGMKYTYDDLVSSMRKDGWKGDPVDVIKMPNGQLTSMDNTRIAASRDAGIEVNANIRKFDEKRPD